jgi:hypothetical protein
MLAKLSPRAALLERTQLNQMDRRGFCLAGSRAQSNGPAHEGASNNNPLPKEIALSKADGWNPLTVCKTRDHRRRAEV